jgi:uncharacterized RDD family membrane protein YckC
MPPPGEGYGPPPGQQPGYGPPPGQQPGYGPPPGYGAPQGYGGQQGHGGQAQLATWGERVIGWLPEFGVGLVISVIGNVLGTASSTLALLFSLVNLAWWLYNGYLNGETGQSVGKRLTGLRVVSEATGQPIGGGMGVVRQFAHVVDAIICGIGYLFPLWDAKKQTIADKLVSTLVLSGQQKQPFSADVFKP